MGSAVRELGAAYSREFGARTLEGRSLARAARAGTERDILGRRQVREETWPLLERHHTPAVSRHVQLPEAAVATGTDERTVKADLARIGAQVSGQERQRGGLAGPVRSNDREPATCRDADLQVHVAGVDPAGENGGRLSYRVS